MNISNQLAPDKLTGHRAKWNIYDRIPEELSKELDRLNLSHMLGHILYTRGHNTLEQITEFAKGTAVNYNPYLLPNMIAVVDLINYHMVQNNLIAVYGDFDCDGASASAIMYEVLTSLGSEPVVIIPQRREGHGLADFRLDELGELGVKLLITVDCGVTAVKEVEHAHRLGMDVIITDHHMPGPVLPKCLIVNPNLPESQYPFKSISGAGVAYKLCQALASDISFVDDLVALGTIADVVPIRDENRSIVLRGLAKMRQKERPGLLALLKASGIDLKRLDTNSVAFYIAPKINSANRMSDPVIAYELLITKEEKRAKELAKMLGVSNKQRQELLEEHFADITSLIDKDQFTSDVESGKQAPILIVRGDWPPGISGLIASRLTEAYGVPAICAAENEWGEVSASARSVPSVSIISIIEKCGHKFRKFGGHAGAAGFLCSTIEEYESAMQCLRETARLDINTDETGAVLPVDAEINLNQVSLYAVEQIDRLGPYGQEFPEPLFLARNIKLVGRKTMSDGKHISATAIKGWHRVRAVFFSHDLELEMTDEEQEFDLVFNMSINTWKGRPEVQILIRDWRISD